MNNKATRDSFKNFIPEVDIGRPIINNKTERLLFQNHEESVSRNYSLYNWRN